MRAARAVFGAELVTILNNLLNQGRALIRSLGGMIRGLPSQLDVFVDTLVAEAQAGLVGRSISIEGIISGLDLTAVMDLIDDTTLFVSSVRQAYALLGETIQQLSTSRRLSFADDVPALLMETHGGLSHGLTFIRSLTPFPIDDNILARGIAIGKQVANFVKLLLEVVDIVQEAIDDAGSKPIAEFLTQDLVPALTRFVGLVEGELVAQVKNNLQGVSGSVLALAEKVEYRHGLVEAG